jgi:hypothetical protein
MEGLPNRADGMCWEKRRCRTNLGALITKGNVAGARQTDSTELDPTVLVYRPPEPLDKEHSKKESGKSTDPLHAHLLALVMLGFGSPRKEGGHVLRHLRCSGRSTVFILDGTVFESLGHSDLAAREVRVKVQLT